MAAPQHGYPLSLLIEEEKKVWAISIKIYTTLLIMFKMFLIKELILNCIICSTCVISNVCAVTAVRIKPNYYECWCVTSNSV